MDEIRSQLPAGLEAHMPYDASAFIQDSIDEVFTTLVEAVADRAGGDLSVAGFAARGDRARGRRCPLSLVGAAFLMLLAGFSINLLTLLAMVLAIGLVVDDAIVVVENVHRHIEMGKSRIQAAIDGARELGLPIIAMTTTLVAVYAPIGFMGGLVGTLFTEFAFSLAGCGADIRRRRPDPVTDAVIQGPAAGRQSRALRAGGRTLLRVAVRASICAGCRAR